MTPEILADKIVEFLRNDSGSHSSRNYVDKDSRSPVAIISGRYNVVSLAEKILDVIQEAERHAS